MNPNFIATLFIALELAPIQAHERFEMTYSNCLLEVTVHRGSGSIEHLVLVNTGTNMSFDDMELFDPKRMELDERNSWIHALHSNGRNQLALARLFQMSESSISKILKKGPPDEFEFSSPELVSA